MASEYTYSPRMDFFIERVDRATGFEMPCFHIHHKYEIYYEIEGTRRYFIEDAAYIVNAGSVVLIGDNQIHKTASVGDTPSSRIVLNFSAEYLGKIAEIFPEVDFFSFLSEEHNHLLSNITVKQQNHIYSMLQQLLELQEQTSAEGEAVRKMLLATLLLELKDLCKQQQAQGGHDGSARENDGQGQTHIPVMAPQVDRDEVDVSPHRRHIQQQPQPQGHSPVEQRRHQPDPQHHRRADDVERPGPLGGQQQVQHAAAQGYRREHRREQRGRRTARGGRHLGGLGGKIARRVGVRLPGRRAAKRAARRAGV